MVKVSGPVPQDPRQFSGGLPVKRGVSHIDFEVELHRRSFLVASTIKDLEKMFVRWCILTHELI
jgi:hypothetical protein